MSIVGEYEARKSKRGCTVCGLSKDLHFYKSHPYSPQYKAATYKLDSLGINTNAVVGLDTESTRDRIQAEGREMFRRGMLFENGKRLQLACEPDEDYRHDIDLGDLRPNPHPPGRAIIELFTGKGLVGSHPDPTKRIYVVQDENWPSIFAHVVALSAQAKKREPRLRVGQRVIVERSMADKVRFFTPTSGDMLAEFQVIHVDDIYAIA